LNADTGYLLSGYLLRPANQTYLTFPEWYIVRVSSDYADWISNRKPSNFPYIRSLYDFWMSYYNINKVLRYYPSNSEYHGMIWIIGISQTLEYITKSLYENTFGRLTEMIG
jgi:hypothetical protein